MTDPVIRSSRIPQSRDVLDHSRIDRLIAMSTPGRMVIDRTGTGA
jgi:hypothetical protein